jgi:hypothetical protein
MASVIESRSAVPCICESCLGFFTLRATRCVLYRARCMLHVAWCGLYGARCMFMMLHGVHSAFAVLFGVRVRSVFGDGYFAASASGGSR